MERVRYNLDMLSVELEDACCFAQSRGFQGLANTIMIAKDQLCELGEYRATGLSPSQLDDYARKLDDVRTVLGYATIDECWAAICDGHLARADCG